MQIIRMLPEQAAKDWDVIKPAIAMSLPNMSEYDEVPMTNILNKIIAGDLHCWLLQDGGEAIALATTYFVEDPDGMRSLIIYTLYGYIRMSIEILRKGFEGLEAWARGKGCSYMLAFADDERVVDMWKRAGDISVRYMMNKQVR